MLLIRQASHFPLALLFSSKGESLPCHLEVEFGNTEPFSLTLYCNSAGVSRETLIVNDEHLVCCIRLYLSYMSNFKQSLLTPVFTQYGGQKQSGHSGFLPDSTPQKIFCPKFQFVLAINRKRKDLNLSIGLFCTEEKIVQLYSSE